MDTYPSTQDLIDGRGLLKRTFGLHHGTHLLHVEHESVEGLLDVVLLLFGCRIIGRYFSIKQQMKMFFLHSLSPPRWWPP